MTAIKEVISKYLLLWLILLSAIAFFAERLLPLAIFVESKAALPWLIVVTMFAIGWTLPYEEIRQVAKNWPTVFGGTAIQFVTMPCLAYLLAKAFGFQGSLFLGAMMVGCVPGAMASNVLTLMARGNTSYSVSLTTMATLLSPIVVPLALSLTLGESVDRSVFVQSAVKLSWMVVLPVLSGYFLSGLFPNQKQVGETLGSIIANLTILWIIAFVVATNRDQLGKSQLSLVGMLLTLNALGYAAGFFGGRAMGLTESMRRALTLEVGMQNAGLGTVLVAGLFPDDQLALVPPALYTFGCMLTGTMLARFWSGVSTELAEESTMKN